MKHVEKSKLNAPQAPNFKRSLLAMCIIAATSQGQAFAAEPAAAAEPEEVVVTGIRASLQSAQTLKKEAATVKDVVTASDISALPDKSVTEALSRVPGVAIERFNGPGDSDHFGAEGSGVSIRGMNKTRSEFNGRDSFSASGGGGLNFGDIPPELMGSVEVVKNLTADLIEGGISGSVNLNTRKPFDHEGMQAVGNVKASYGDMSEEVSPEFSGLFSNRWDTAIGEFGALFNLSTSKFQQRTSGVGVHNFYERGVRGELDYYNKNVAGTLDSKGVKIPTVGAMSNAPDGEIDGYPVGPYLTSPSQKADGIDALYMPASISFRNQDSDRTRNGFANSYQWKSPDEKWLATFEFIRSETKLAWTERAVENKNSTGAQFRDNLNNGDAFKLMQSSFYTTALDRKKIVDGNDPVKLAALAEKDAKYAASPLRGVSDFNSSFDENGRFTHGIISNVGYIALTRVREEQSLINDVSFNLKYTPTEQLTVTADVALIDASASTYDFVIHNQMDLDMYTDLRGKTPFIDVLGLATVDKGTDLIYRNSTVTDANNVVLRSAMDYAGDSVGDAESLKLDGEYTFEDIAWIKGVKTGVRYAEKHQDHKDGDYNWGVVSPEWNGTQDAYGKPHPYAKITGANHPEFMESYDFGSNYHGGGVLAGQTQFLFPKESFAKDRNAFWNAITGDLDPTQAGVQGYYGATTSYQPLNPDGSVKMVQRRDPVTKEFVDVIDPVTGKSIPVAMVKDAPLMATGNEGNIWVLPQFRGDYKAKNVNDLIAGTDFRESNINELDQSRSAIYGRMDFGNEDLPVAIKGNVGLRYVSIDLVSTGFTRFPTLAGEDVANLVDGAQFDPVKAAFSNGASDPTVYNAPNYSAALPSLNLTFGFTDEFLVRFAVSKAIYLPTLDQLKASLGLNVQKTATKVWVEGSGEPDPENPGGPNLHELRPGLVPDGDLLGYTDPKITGFDADAGSNPYLMPEESINTDLTAEWYFSDVGSLTFSLFNKSLTNLIQQNTRTLDFTNPTNGFTESVSFTGPGNVGDGIIRGFELAHQQTYDDFLPDVLDGLGTQANFTYVEAEQTTPYVPKKGRYRDFANLQLEGLSEYTANLTVFYETDKISTRFAYNWRSEYLLTRRDAITKSPVFIPDNAFLDYSFRYNITDQYKVGFEVNNVLNEQSETRIQYDEAGNTDPRNFFVNDRKFAITFGATY